MTIKSLLVLGVIAAGLFVSANAKADATGSATFTCNGSKLVFSAQCIDNGPTSADAGVDGAVVTMCPNSLTQIVCGYKYHALIAPCANVTSVNGGTPSCTNQDSGSSPEICNYAWTGETDLNCSNLCTLSGACVELGVAGSDWGDPSSIELVGFAPTNDGCDAGGSNNSGGGGCSIARSHKGSTLLLSGFFALALLMLRRRRIH